MKVNERDVLTVIAVIFLALIAVVSNSLGQTNVQVLTELANEYALRANMERGPVFQRLRSETSGPMGLINMSENVELVGVDQYGHPMVLATTNLNAAYSVGTNRVWPGGGAGFDLTGSGTTVNDLAIWDAGAVLTSHVEFGGRVQVLDGTASTHAHATHVAGTLVASGVNSSAKGMSYEAQLGSYDWNYDSAEMAAAASNGLNVSNHSYGYITGWYYNGNWYWYGDPTISQSEDYHFGFYTSYTREVDEIAYNAPYYTIVKSAGNDRGDGPAAGTGHYVWSNGSWTWSTLTRPLDGGNDGYDCIGWIGTAKNIITVGAVNDVANGYNQPGDVSMSSFSGWGPTDDGRIKPDIVANGVGLYSSVSYSNSSYASYSGTSMSSPNAAGSINLLYRWYEETHDGETPRASTIKALVVHTADEAGNAPGPDYIYGWGLLNTDAAAEVIAEDAQYDESIREASLANHATDVYLHSVEQDGPVTVTISWTDPAGIVPGASLDPTTPNLVNDLDIRLHHLASGEEYEPYILNPALPSSAATTGDNTRDNVEKIYVANAPAGTYEIEVSHKGSLAATPQVYSLVVSGLDEQAPFDPINGYVQINANVDVQLDELVFDNNNRAALDESASDGYDAGIDIYEPGHPPSAYVSVYFPHSEWNAPLGDNFMTDIRNGSQNLGEEVEVWRFNVETDQIGQTIELEFSWSDLPDTVGILLYDVTGENYQDLRQTSTYSFTAANQVHVFDLRVGDATSPQLAITAPTDGQVWTAGETHAITWEVQDQTPIRYALVDVSTNGGTSWTRLDSLAGTVLSHNWDTPYEYVEEGRVRVTVEDWLGFEAVDEVEFSLDNPDGPDVVFTFPVEDDSLIFEETYTIQWTYDVIPGSQVTSATLSYSIDNGVNWQVLTDVLTSQTSWDWTVPASTPTNSARLRIVATDTGGNSGSGISDPFWLLSNDFLATFAEGWHLFSLPLIPENNSVGAVIGDDIQNGLYMAYSYSSDQGHAVAGQFDMGHGYWLGLENTGTVTIDVTGDRMTDSTVIPLNRYWNLIGQPLPATRLLESLWFTDGQEWLAFDDAVIDGWISSTLYGYNNQTASYQIATDLDPMDARWLMALTDGISVITYANPPENDGQGDGNELDEEELDELENWFVGLIVTQGEVSNTIAGFGVAEDATDGFDGQHDAPAPPLSPNGQDLRVTVSHPEWNDHAGTFYSRDIREAFKNGEQRWVFTVTSWAAGEVTVQFDELAEQVPQGFSATAMHDGGEVNLFEMPQLTFAVDGPYSFTVSVSAPVNDAAENNAGTMPTEYAIESVYPNPFNPTTQVQIGLPDAAELQVVVYNVVGQQVAMLANGRYGAGSHIFSFHAEGLPSSIYFLHAKAPGKLDQVRKIALVR